MALLYPDVSETQGFEPLVGTKRAKIQEATPGTSNAGNPKLVVKFAVDHDSKSIPRTGHIPIRGKGAFMFENLLRACGFKDVADELRRSKTLSSGFDSDDLVGCSLDIVFKLDPQDSSRDTIDKYLPIN